MKTTAPLGIHFREAGRKLILLGGLGTGDAVRMGGTQFAKAVLDTQWGLPPVLDMDYEKRVQGAIREVVVYGLAESAHDLSDGGLAVALAESAFGKASVGASVKLDSDLDSTILLFHEGPSRVLVSTADAAKVLEVAKKHGVEAVEIGVTVKDNLEIANKGTVLVKTPVSALKEGWATALEKLLNG
jgi:phosphoribosylformylglycinamidine synthase